MTSTLPSSFLYSSEVARAVKLGLPVVALESTVITHGLPRPQNLSLSEEMEAQIRNEGGIPATIAVLEGWIKVGLSAVELDQLAMAPDPVKVSRRDFSNAIWNGLSGGTTVAGTMYVAHLAGINVFATGGIGGVHREHRFDVSSDLQALADTPMIVVCAGAKSILDLPATLEYLETMSVPVVGWQTDEFPAFFSTTSHLPVSMRIDSVDEFIDFYRWHKELESHSALLIAQPIPAEAALNGDEIHDAEKQASREASEKGILGQALTPFLLKRVNELTKGKSLKANLALLLNNARLAAQISRALAGSGRQKAI
jgi:pseudouridine-5'-phosphate glycosidase